MGGVGVLKMIQKPLLKDTGSHRWEALFAMFGGCFLWGFAIDQRSFIIIRKKRNILLLSGCRFHRVESEQLVLRRIKLVYFLLAGVFEAIKSKFQFSNRYKLQVLITTQ